MVLAELGFQTNKKPEFFLGNLQNLPKRPRLAIVMGRRVVGVANSRKLSPLRRACGSLSANPRERLFDFSVEHIGVGMVVKTTRDGVLPDLRNVAGGYWKIQPMGRMRPLE